MSSSPFTSQSALERRFQGENPIRTLLYLYSGQRVQLLLAAIFLFIKGSPVWVMPLMTARIIDIVAAREPNRLGELWFSGLILGIFLVQNIPTHYIYIKALSIASRTMETQLRSAICRRLQHLSVGYYTRQSAGKLQAKVLRDVEAIEQTTRLLYDGGLMAVGNLTFSLVTTALRAPLFLAFFAITVPIAAFVVRSLRTALADRNKAFRQQLERMSARVIEMTNLIPITRAHGLEENEMERVDATLWDVREAGLQLDSINAIFGAVSWVMLNLFNMGCLLFTSWAYYTQWIPISLGDIFLLTGYFNSLTNSAMGIANMIPQITKGFESIRSVGEVLECPDLEQNQGKEAITRVKGDLVFENVCFEYPDGEAAAVNDFSLHVKPGETVALVGPSGAGKSTVLSLVIGFVRPTSGRILLDGKDMEALDLRTYRRFLATVPQESVLFDGTVRENITYGLPTVSDEVVLKALQDANALEFVERMPLGWDTPIGERGARLSGGQKQRIAIARALIRNPRVLILDEATSALDTESEALIQDALERLMRGRTTFVVAHRLSTIRNARRIVAMERGRIMETGTHNELMALNGAYARLQAHQVK